MPRQLPSAPEAEASLLGTMLVYPASTRIAMEEGLSEDDFFVEANRKIFRVASDLYNSGQQIDLTTVYTRLNDLNLLNETGGIEYLTKLSDASVTSYNTKSYVELIRDKAIARKMIETAEKIAEDGFENSSDIDAYLDDAEKSVLDISRNRKTAEFRTPQDVMRAVMERVQMMSENKSDITGYKTGFVALDHRLHGFQKGERVQMMSENKSDITGYKTGFVALDHRLHGFQKGDLVILAARPAMGKTAVALNLAMNVATYNQPGAVAIFSLEMPAEQLGMRLLSARSHVPGDNIKTGRLSNDEWNAVNEAAADLGKLPVYIDDTSMIKIPEIFSKCRRLQAEHGLNLVLIDYIQLITGSGKRGDNRQQEVSDISRSLKALARELSVPVIALSQLSRTVEQREDKHPMLSDLRESGAIEQDADIVLMLYREAYYKDEAKEAAQESGSEKLEINIAKHRNGSTGRVIVAFEGATNALYNIQNDNDFIPNE